MAHGLTSRVFENDRAKILRDFQIQTENLLMVKQQDVVLVDKQRTKAVATVLGDSNIRKNEH